MNSSRYIVIDAIEKMNESEYKGLKNKPIILLTCSAKEIYSCLIEIGRKYNKKIANPTQVLFCQ